MSSPTPGEAGNIRRRWTGNEQVPAVGGVILVFSCVLLLLASRPPV
jgi:hypothetical protein